MIPTSGKFRIRAPLPWRQGELVHLITTTAVQAVCGVTPGAVSTRRGDVTCPECLRADERRRKPKADS